MTLAAEALLDAAPLPRDLPMQVREERRAADAAEVRILLLEVEFARGPTGPPGTTDLG